MDQITHDLQNRNIPSTFLFYHRLFCVASLWFEKEQQPACLRFNLVSVSTSRHFPFPQNKAFLGPHQWWRLVTTRNGKAKSRGQVGEKQLETIVESCRHESMRKENRSMTKLWHLIPQNTPEVLSCICLGNSVVKQCLFSGCSLSGRKGSSHICINWMKTTAAISKDGHLPAQRTNEASSDLMVALTCCSVDLVFPCLVVSLRTLVQASWKP